MDSTCIKKVIMQNPWNPWNPWLLLKVPKQLRRKKDAAHNEMRIRFRQKRRTPRRHRRKALQKQFRAAPLLDERHIGL